MSNLEFVQNVTNHVKHVLVLLLMIVLLVKVLDSKKEKLVLMIAKELSMKMHKITNVLLAMLAVLLVTDLLI